ncbi:MAG: hypothetical protein HN919_02570 [Verrucomicrobia bacterium]|nr:hypothetical protein [Verrucomicrobiota bacterium]MBT7700668.1 hypothetical protein [Verrucomicrobiota bacterium]
MKNRLTFYFISLIVICAATAYPIYMGVTALTAYHKQGFVEAANYPKYIIPYTPLSIALLLVVALMPFLYEACRKHALPIASVTGTVVFLVCERYLETVKVLVGHKDLPIAGPVEVSIESWQLGLCASIPQVTKALTEAVEAVPAALDPIYAVDDPSFKVHFYLIALVILLALTHVVYGFTEMFRENHFEKKRPLIAQLFAVVIFVGLCILACFTAFYRTGTMDVSPISAFLMSVFFILFGVTSGTYFACLFYGKSRPLSVVVPVVMALATTLAMYVGELVMTGGELFKFGTGWLFDPIAGIPYAIIDILVILLAGAITFGLTRLLAPAR